MHLNLTPIATLHSCFKEKFGIPRQPGLATAAQATLELHGEYAHPDCVRGLESCSHIWVLFLFSEHLDKGWTPLVRPPRLDGNKRMGVFATRSTFRPNPIGLSVVRLERIEINQGRILLHLSGVDIMDGTPVLDIKPYLPYADAVPDASNDFAGTLELPRTPVRFVASAEAICTQAGQTHPHLRQLIEQMLRCDPRPAYRQGSEDDREYGARLHDFNVRWRVNPDHIEVIALEPVGSQEPSPRRITPNS